MKYRIKIEHLNNGQKKYTPQVKKHLFGIFGIWENIIELSTSKTMRHIFDSKEGANNAIERFNEFLHEEWGNKAKTVIYKEYRGDK